MLTHPNGMRLELFQHEASVPGLQGATPIEAIGTRGYGHFAFRAPGHRPVFDAALAAGAAGQSAAVRVARARGSLRLPRRP